MPKLNENRQSFNVHIIVVGIHVLFIIITMKTRYLLQEDIHTRTRNKS